MNNPLKQLTSILLCLTLILGMAGNIAALAAPGSDLPDNEELVSDDDVSEFWRTIVTKTDREGNGSIIKADRAGRAVAEQNELGFWQYFTYDIYGNLTSIRDANNHSTIFAYDDSGNLLSITDAEGVTLSMTYDANNNVLTSAHADGSTVTNVYDISNNLVSSTDERGLTATFTYNSRGQVLTRTVPGLGTVTYEYYETGIDKGRLKSETDFLGGTVTYTYNARGNVLSINNYAADPAYSPPGKTAMTTILTGDTYDFWKKAKADERYMEQLKI